METTRKNPVPDMIDKISFVNYLPLLARATADNHEPVSGYLYNEIESISRQPEPTCHLLVDYLAQRLGRPSAVVKVKVLKIMHYLIQNGPKNFRCHLRKKDGSIKMAMSYQEAPNPLTGNSAVEAVRKQSQELLLLLYDAQLMASDEAAKPQQQSKPSGPSLGGLGSTGKTTGKYEGFGNSPVHKEATFAEKMLSTFERWVTSPDKTDLLIQEALASSPGDYKPVVVDHLKLPQRTMMPNIQPPKQNARRVHIPGKAGGGWDDEMELGGSSGSFEENVSVNSSEQAETTDRESEVDISTETNTPEILVVQDFCTAGPLPCSLADIRSTGQRCTQLNAKEVVQAIVQVLEKHVPEDAERNPEAGCLEVQLIRAMLLLEWLLRTDVMHPHTIAEMCCPALSRIVSTHADSSLAELPPLQAKAQKLLLILQKLQTLPR